MLPPRHWQKSSHSKGEANCVELARIPTGLLLRESTAPDQIMAASPSGLRGLLQAIKLGSLGAR
jgi:hypothetical protein